jgi:fibronectin-binding autotransporter adhesin
MKTASAFRRHAILALAAAGLLLPTCGLRSQEVIISGDVSPSPATTPTWNVGGFLFVGDTAVGNMTISTNGTVSNTAGVIGFTFSSVGEVNVTGGNWTNSGELQVGSSGNGSLTLSNGTVSNTTGIIGLGFSSTGVVNVTGGNWTNSGELYVGFEGNGSLTLSNGTVSNTNGVIGTSVGSTGVVNVTGGNWTNSGNVILGEDLGTTGTLNLLGGIVTAAQVNEGPGNGTVTFNGGTLRLTGNQTALFSGFETGDVTLLGNSTVGGTIDTQAFNVATALVLTGNGSLTKQGNGTLTLNGNNTYTGGTTVANGTLRLLNNNAVGTGNITTTGSVISYGNGITINNPIVLNSNDTQLEVLGTDSATQAGVISETGGARPLEKIGNGTLNLTAANTYTGGTTVRNGTLAVNSGGSITHTSANLTVGLNSGDNATLTVGANSTVSNNLGLIGNDAGSTGTVTVDGGNWTNAGQIDVGRSGNGSLTLNNGTVSSVGGIIGNSANSTGTVMVNGGNWTNSNALFVGQRGNGTLTIGTNGTISNSSGVIGSFGGSSGAVTVNGGNWTNNATLTVGRESNGTLTLNSGSVSNTSGVIGSAGGATGTVTVNGGNWTNSGNLTLGFESPATGTLNLSGGVVTAAQVLEGTGNGTVTFNGGTLRLNGNQAALFSGFETGDVTLVGPGGGTIDTQAFSVETAYALSGNGSLSKEGNGTLTLTGNNTYTGGTTVRNGTLTVSGGGAINHSSTNLTIGLDSGDNATFTLSNGTVSNRGGIVGLNSGSTGVVNVTGGNWTNSESLTVGRAGNGTLNLSDGTVSNTLGVVGQFFGSTGVVTVSGGNWTNSGTLIFGLLGGNGTLNLSNGTVSNTSASVGGSSGSTGVVNVTGGNWTNSGSVELGRFSDATGTLNLLGGIVTAAQVFEGAGNGTVTFNGGTLRLNGNQAALFSGFETGDVTLVGNSTVGGTIDTQAFSVETAYSLSGNGSLTKQGNGTLTLTGNNTYTGGTTVRNGTLAVNSGGSITHTGAVMTVGLNSGDNATLTVGANSTVSNNLGHIGNDAGSTGTVTVDGGTWTNSNALNVGVSGNGTLTLNNGTVSSVGGFIGSQVNSTGTVTVNGGNWTNSAALLVGAQGNGSLTLNNGTVSSSQGFIGSFGNSTGTVTVNGGNWTNSGSLTLGLTANTTGTLNLNGGVTTASQVSEGTGNGTVTFNGGTLRLTGNQTDLFDGFESGDVTLVGSGGTIDTQAFTVATGYALTGNGSLTKQGNGTLTLTGNNTYTGDTLVRNGTLAVNGGGSITHTSSRLFVGFQSGDNATFTLSNGTISSEESLLGSSSGAVGVANVSGGNWTNTSVLIIGGSGNGTLNLSNGIVSSSTTIVASGANGTGTVGLTGGVLQTGQVQEGNGNGTVTFNGGTLQLTGNQAALFSGFETGDVTLVGPGGGTIDTQAFSVATALVLTGNGSLTKQGNGTLTLTGNNTYTGGTTVRNGTLAVNSSGSVTHTSADLTVGLNSGDNATLTVGTNSTVSAFRGFLGFDGGSTGNATVSGGNLTLADELYVGYTGNGNLTISNGTVSNTKGFIGVNNPSVSSANITGGQWNNTGELTVGYGGQGSLEISGNGTVNSVGAFLGFLAASDGNTVGIAGANASWSSTGVFYLGHDGSDNSVTVSTGALLANGNSDFLIGSNAGSDNNSLTINGTGSRFTSNGTFYVGRSGTGNQFEVSAGGNATSRNVRIGGGSGSNGTTDSNGATVDGAGSLWNITGTLRVGSNGDNSSLTISNGGNVTATGNSFVGYDAVSDSNRVRVTGNGSTLAANALIIGRAGTNNTVTVESGGTLSATTITLGELAGSIGSLLIGNGTASGLVQAGNVVEGLGNGTATFNGGTLRLTGNQTALFSGFEDGDVTLAGTGGTLDTQAFDVETSLGLSGNGSLTKQGNGSLTLSGNNTYTGATNINAGSFFVTGSLGNTAVTVANGGTLGGDGSIGGSVTVQSGGFLSLLNTSTDTLVMNSLTLDAGSTTRLEILTATKNDLLQVTNNANLNGTLDLAFGFTPTAGDRFTLITADSFTLSGNATTGFSNITTTGLGAALKTTVDIVTTSDPNDFDIVIDVSQGDFLPFGRTPNQQSVATALDEISRDETLEDLIDYLNTLPESELPKAFDQLAPEELAALAITSFANTRGIFSMLQNRIREIQNGQQFSGNGLTFWDDSRQFQQSLLASSGSGLVPGTEIYQPALRDDKRMGFFVSGQGVLGDVNGDGNGDAYDFTTGGMIVGMDYRLLPGMAVGIYGGYQGSTSETSTQSEIKSDSGKFGAYASYWHEKGSWLSANIGGGAHEYETERAALGGIASGNTGGTEINAQFALGHDFKAGKWTFGPEADLAYTRIWIDGFTESGSLAPLAIEDQEADSLRTTLAWKVSYDWQIQKMTLRPYGRIGWQHEFMDDQQAVGARFVGGGGSIFTVQSPDVARDSIVAGAGAQALFSESVSAWMGYNAEANADYLIHQINGSLTLRF